MLDITKHIIHTGCPSDLVLPLQQQMELAYGGVATIVQEAEQHRTCLDKLHSVYRQQMQKWAEHLMILAASFLENCSIQMEVHSLQCNRYLT